MEAIKCEVVWSWVGKRAFLQNDLIPPTPILLTEDTDAYKCLCIRLNRKEFDSFTKRTSHSSRLDVSLGMVLLFPSRKYNYNHCHNYSYHNHVSCWKLQLQSPFTHRQIIHFFRAGV